jgi:hypothetical protein
VSTSGYLSTDERNDLTGIADRLLGLQPAVVLEGSTTGRHIVRREEVGAKPGALKRAAGTVKPAKAGWGGRAM